MSIYVASHRHLDLLIPQGHVPLFVGAALHDGLERRDGWKYDDEAPAISEKNKTFCELTGLYWMWKHADDEIVGLVHYRRYFLDGQTRQSLTLDGARILLDRHDCLMARRVAFERNGYQLEVARQYRECHSSLDLRILRNVISDCFPRYLKAFDHLMQSKSLRPRNMFVCKRELFNRYCAFLFETMDALEHAIDPYSYRTEYQQRVFGFLAERLFNVFVEAEGLDVLELDLVDPTNGFADNMPSRSVCPTRPKATWKARFFRPRLGGVDFSPVFDARFYLGQYPLVNKQCKDDPSKAFRYFLEEGVYLGHSAHRCFNIASYRPAHPELESEFGEDAIMWCLHYLHTRNEELYGFGYENLDFAQPDKKSAFDGSLVSINGAPIRAEEILNAQKRALKQGVIG